MKKNLYILAIVFVIFNINYIFSQSSDNIVHNQSKTDNTEILSENNTINIFGKKDDFIYFNISKECRIKINDSIGLKRYSEIIFPQTFDPSYIFHNSDIRNINNCLTKLKIISINGKLIKADGQTQELQIKKTFDKIRSVSASDFYEFYEQPHYYFTNLQIGDELVLNYNYEVPYVNNFEKLTSFRIFFNSIDIKKNYKLHISGDKDLNLDPKYYNKSEPDSIIKKENMVHFYWNKIILDGVMDEPGSRPYISLPFIVFTIKPYDRLYDLPYSNLQTFFPFYAIAASLREREFVSIFASVLEGVKTKQYLGIDKFIQEHSSDIKNDSLGYELLHKIHNTLVDDFTYDCDTMHFRHEDIQTERLGDYLNSRKIREISRYNVYAALISKIDLNFYSAYLVDKRFGEITNEFVKPMFDSDFLFAVLLKNNNIKMLYPKNARFGYYLNEIPFYFENTKTRLVHILDYHAAKKPVNEEFRFIYTAKSNFSDNERKSNVKVDIDFDKLKVLFNAKILLRGQYSTMTRGLYQHNYKDKTINPLYNKKIFEINPYTKLISKEVSVKEKTFPFKTYVNIQYSSDSLIKKKQNGNYQLDLKNWFNHIYYKNLPANNRRLDFYPDFAGNDTYTYMIKFNKNIEIINPLSKIEITNDFGILNIEMSIPDPSTLIITSYFVTRSETISSSKIQLVKDIYDKINALNSTYIEFKVLN